MTAVAPVATSLKSLPGGFSGALDAAPLSRFHRRAVLVSGVGFFTDAYDLFVISTVATLVSARWDLTTTETSWVSGSAILGAFFGALAFGRLADLVGRRKVYAMVAAVMIAGALSSALAPGFAFLVGSRFLLGLGIGGDYPVSAVLMSEYSNRHDRGRLVGLVFSMQALGLVVGPLVALGLLESHVPAGLAWRLLLGFGALPAAGVVYMRAKMPESPRFVAAVAERRQQARVYASGLAHAAATGGTAAKGRPGRQRSATGSAADGRHATSLHKVLTDRRLLALLAGTAGSWFVFDYAYYGNTLSLPAIIKSIDPSAGITAKLAWQLAMFVVFAVPGYALAVWKMDAIGHRRLQDIGFTVLAAVFLLMATVPALTSTVGLFVAMFGLSYFFVQFGPNTTTFVLPSEVFPVWARTTSHGFSAGLGKLGAFLGVFIVPWLQAQAGLRWMLAIASLSAVAGLALTRLLPEPARRDLDDCFSVPRWPEPARPPTSAGGAPPAAALNTQLSSRTA